MKERNRRVGKGTILFFAKDEFCNSWVITIEDFEVRDNKSVEVPCRCTEDGCNMVLNSYDLYEVAHNKMYNGKHVLIANDIEAEHPYVSEDGEALYSFECEEVDNENNKVPIEEREEMVFEVPKGFEYEIKKVDGKCKVVMWKSHNVLKANNMTYDDFSFGGMVSKHREDMTTYFQMKAISALSYIRRHDKDFLVNDIDWGDTMNYIGWDNFSGSIEIRKVDALSMGADDIRVGTELLLFNSEKEANRFIKRYSESINMNELICNYYRFDYEE